ncbi:amino acid/amide ABC transporter ATP-binding protein 1 (HAAT family) [Nocardioides albertanoniae]|uniref:Amino acid/amide ABC transporter ATP-binding protein 1 (HAAT family) n=1 Tax=Nocardioides albertanoniae TaxID=1175486 RepID=A0A543A0Z5_9ACTN|nr:ABC transporter ATP-binding protein [Nocardioides albertanoniae]TQL66269.1 amino acid/amide ABC transporter ATP-binding protein 1 (HAAT family) [Nocardioides albertanoniae]
MTLLDADGLAKSFGQVVTARSVSFHVAAGEALGIVGPNGAGKSTLLNLITGALPVDAGRIGFDGADITRAPAAHRTAMGIGRTFQIPRPFEGMTVFENALVGSTFGAGLRRRAADAQAWEALETAGLTHVANAPAGSLRLLDRKRLELARALATRPRLLLLDEIAGGLTEHELPALISTVAAIRDGGTGVIWIEHIVHALLQVVDRLMCLAQGDVVATGDPREVMASDAVASVYLGSPDLEGETP